MNSGSIPDESADHLRSSDAKTPADDVRLSEQRYRDLFDNMVEGFFIAEVLCDAAGEPMDYRYLDANPAFEPLTGLKREQVIGRTAKEVPGVEDHWIKTFGRVALTGEPARLCEYAAALNRYYETVAYSPRRGQFACHFRDVTDRRRAEDALRESEQRLRFHMENTPLAVVEWGRDFRLTHWSGEAERIFGWRADEVLGKRMDEFRWVYEDDVQLVSNVSAGLVDGTGPRSVSRNRNYRKDGSVIHCEWYNSSLVDESGKLVSILSLVLDVTERKLAEEQVRRTLESIGDGFYACDSEWRFVYVNTVAERLLGITREQVLGKVCWDVFPVAVGTTLEKEYRRAAAGEIREFENFFHPWGRWFHIRCFPRQGGGLSVYFQDITRRKRVEEESRRSATLVRAITDSTGDVIFAKDLRGRLTFANPATLALIGRPASEVMGKTDADFLHDKAAARQVMENDRRIMTTGIGEDIEEFVPLPDGSRRVWFSRKLPYRDRDGNIIGLLGISRDITDRKRVEAELDRVAQQRQLALDAAAMGWWHYDPVSRIARWDDRYKEIFQVTGYERPNDEILKRLHPDDLPGVWAKVEAALDPVNPQPYHAEYRINLPDGSLRWVEAHGVAMFEGEGITRRAISFVGTVTDITERKRTEHALMRSEKLAVLGRMAATVAHEINNPLAAVMNTVYLARTEPDCPENVRQFLKMADEELKRISHITRQALGFYREASAPGKVSIGALLDESVDLFKSKIKSKCVTVEKQYSPHLHVTGIAGELRQVFSNLLSNSLDAVAEGGTVKIRGSHHGLPGCFETFVRVTVADNGKGIDSDSMPRIFEPLFSTKGAFGTGLGLWVTRQLVEKHGGSISIRSATHGLRRGTTFSIFLPASNDAEGPSRTHRSSSALPVTSE